jgi:hypothetical protein
MRRYNEKLALKPHSQPLRFFFFFFFFFRPRTRRSRSIRWDEKAGLRRDAVGSQVIDVLEAQEIKETGNEEG